MQADLAAQIRTLCDATEPVTAGEAILRAAERGSLEPPRFRPPSPWARRGIPRPRVLALTAGVLVAAGAGIAWDISSTGGPPASRAAVRSGTVPPTRAPIILTAARLHTIARSSSSAAASTGTAEVTETSSQNGVLQSEDVIAVTFDGANIDEKITSDPEPPGSAKQFTTDDRFVDGQFYIYTPGPDGVTEWMHDTDSSGDAASMQFPDPRTLYTAIEPGGDFEVVGTSTSSGGTTLTHLRALDPGAISTSALGSLAGGTLTSFEVWVDSADVVRQMAFASSSTERTCIFHIDAADRAAISAAIRKSHLKRVEAVAPSGGTTTVSLPALHDAENTAGVKAACGPQTTGSQVTVAFANLGAPETVSAPSGAVDYEGKG